MTGQDPMIFYILLLVLVAFSLLCVVLVVLYIRLITKYQSLSEKTSKMVDVPSVEEAQALAKKLVNDAQVKAGEIVTQSEIFTSNQKNLLMDELNKSTQAYSSKYQEALKLAQDEAIRMLKNVPDDVKKEVLAEIERFRTAMQQGLVNAQEEIQTAVRQSFEKVDQDVNSYKAERLKIVDESILKIVEQVARQVLSKEITTDEHEKIVIKALEEAKEQNVFLSQKVK